MREDRPVVSVHRCCELLKMPILACLRLIAGIFIYSVGLWRVNKSGLDGVSRVLLTARTLGPEFLSYGSIKAVRSTVFLILTGSRRRPSGGY